MTNPTFDLKLNIVDSDVSSYPDMARMEFSPDLIARMALAIAGLKLMGLGPVSYVHIPVGNFDMYEDDEPWDEAEKESSNGDFVASSFWLLVGTDSFGLEIWDEYGSAELHGNEPYASVTGLPEAIEAAMDTAYATIQANLAKR